MKKWGAKISAPTLKLNQKLIQLSLTELTQSTQKKKKKNHFSKFSSIFQNPNFQLKNFHSQAFNFTFSMPKF